MRVWKQYRKIDNTTEVETVVIITHGTFTEDMCLGFLEQMATAGLAHMYRYYFASKDAVIEETPEVSNGSE